MKYDCPLLDFIGMPVPSLHTIGSNSRSQLVFKWPLFGFDSINSMFVCVTKYDCPLLDFIGMLKPSLKTIGSNSCL